MTRALTLTATGFAGFAAAALAAFAAPAAFAAGFTPAALATLDLALGALMVRWLHDLTGGDWGQVALPAARSGAHLLPLGLAASLIALFVGRGQLSWLEHPEPVPRWFVATDAAAARTLLYAAAWAALAYVSGLRRSGPIRRTPARGAVALIVHLPLATLFAFDALVVLEPRWYSSAIGLVYLSSQFVAGLALVTLLASLRSAQVQPEGQALADIGTLLFASILFFGYVAFMQYLIIWIGNLPREISWYLARTSGGWAALAVSVVLLKIAIPGALLCVRRLKRSPRALAAIATTVLGGHLLERIWQVAPAFSAGWLGRISLLAAGCGLLGAGSVLLLRYGMRTGIERGSQVAA